MARSHSHGGWSGGFRQLGFAALLLSCGCGSTAMTRDVPRQAPRCQGASGVVRLNARQRTNAVDGFDQRYCLTPALDD